VTRVDLIIVGFAALTALLGFRRGLIRTVLSLLGLALGAMIGARLAQHLLNSGDGYAGLIALGGAIVGAELVQMGAGIVGRSMRAGLRLAPPLHLLDSIGGLAAGAAWGLALAWVAGAFALQIPNHKNWHREARRSQVLQRLNEIAPPSELLRLRSGLF